MTDPTDEEIRTCAHQVWIGPRLFEQACKLGLEGIVSKHRGKTYRSGRCAFWIKVKYPKSPAMLRAGEGNW
jgi:bifunctional non-homologous end joining protein LigD